MKPAPFDYHAPTTVAESVSSLRQLGDEAKLLAGGQSLVPVLALRLARPEHIVDLNRVEELARVEQVDGKVRIGAMVRHVTAATDAGLTRQVPLLARAAAQVGHFQIRNRGTVGGSVAHADPAAEYPAVMLALDAEFEVANASGARTMRADEFFVSTFMTALEAEDLLVAAVVPARRPGDGFAVEEIARRQADFAMAGVTCAVHVDGSTVSAARVAVFGFGPTPLRLTSLEEALTGGSADAPELDDAAAQSAAALDPPEDVHATSDYRRRVAAPLAVTAVRRALEEATRG
jgi:aerobic carbon-monoxide dehydrogenase medium subunit